MSKRTVGYVISHTGKKGGPWEADGEHCVGVSTDHETRPPRGVWNGPDVDGWLAEVRESHPNAKVFRLVRRERHHAEESAVVEAADKLAGLLAIQDALDHDEDSASLGMDIERALAHVCDCVHDLRAKRGK